MYLSISYFSSPPKIQHILKQNLNSTCTTRCNVIFLNNIYFSKLMSLFVNSMYMSEGTAIVLFSKDIWLAVYVESDAVCWSNETLPSSIHLAGEESIIRCLLCGDCQQLAIDDCRILR